jgi:PBSX family phage terminase large subunit
MRNEVIEYDPLPAFNDFHRCTATEAAVIGGYGSGKTIAMGAELLKLALQYEGSEWLLARQTIPSLRDTTEQVFLNMLPPAFLAQCKLMRGGNHVQQITLPNGSLIHFKGLDDWRKLKSLNLAGFFIDEADEVAKETYIGLTTRVRQRHSLVRGAPDIPVRRIRLSLNPAGHDWIWEMFVKGHQLKRVIGDPSGRMAFLSTSLDNPYNPISYIEDMLAMPEPWVRRYVFCSFDDFEGVIYPEWDWKTHVVKPYGAYAGNIFFMGMDPGTSNPTAGVWAYHDQQLGKLVGIAEYLATDTAVSPHVLAWRKIEAAGTHNLSRRPGRMTIRRRIADPTIATRDRGTMNSLESQYRRLNFYFEQGPKNIPDRLPALGEMIHKGFFVVTAECEQLYEQIKHYRYEDLSPDQLKKGVEAKPFKKNVDLVDAAQYISSRWHAPLKPRVERPKMLPANDHEVELFLRVKQLRDAGRLEDAALLEKELIPDGALVDAMHAHPRPRQRPKSSTMTRGLH